MDNFELLALQLKKTFQLIKKIELHTVGEIKNFYGKSPNLIKKLEEVQQNLKSKSIFYILYLFKVLKILLKFKKIFYTKLLIEKYKVEVTIEILYEDHQMVLI